MGAPAILRDVYHHYIEQFGEPNESLEFGDDAELENYPNKIEIFVWHRNMHCELTTLATVGMSILPLPGDEGRGELLMTVRKKITEQELDAISMFLANMAMYSFDPQNKALEWWDVIRDPEPIPLTKSCTSILVHPKFVEKGFDHFEYDGETIRMFNLVPLTSEEADFGREQWDELLKTTDVFIPR